MLFIKLTSRQVEDYSYACTKLQNTLLKMRRARKFLEYVITSSDNKPLVKCLQLFISEALQFENEIAAQMNSFNCTQFHGHLRKQNEKTNVSIPVNDMHSICNYVEEKYIKSYRRLLKDKYLNNSLKSLINNQLQAFLSSITQLRLFNELEPALN